MSRIWRSKWIRLICICGLSSIAVAAPTPPPVWTVTLGKDKKLAYIADEHGDRVPDYSYAGYHAGVDEIPDAPIRIVLEPHAGDCTSMIQAGIDRVAKETPDAQGFRGVVLLKTGKFEVNSGLKITASGIVLRGSGMDEKGTTIVATGTDRRTIIRILGKDDRAFGKPLAVADAYVPVNAMTFHLADAVGLKVGQLIAIKRPSTEDWIKSIQMDDLGGDRHGPSWKAGTRDLTWYRTITKLSEDGQVTIDAPLTCALDSKFGGGTVSTLGWPGAISNVGVENIRFVSDFDSSNPKDEAHAWFVITMDDCVDCWVRRIESHHFAGSTVAVWNTGRRINVEDCKSLEPTSEIGGWRRMPFYVEGQQVFMQRLYSEDARHDFAVGLLAAGPNAFVQCESKRSLEESGAIDSLSAGALFDIVRLDRNMLTLRNRMYEDQGCGWASINGMLWNSTAAVIQCWKVPGAMNTAVGTWGEFSGDGYFDRSNEGANPESLYYAQLGDRIGADKASARANLYLAMNDASSNPDDEGAATNMVAGRSQGPQMSVWIDQLNTKYPLNIAPPAIGLLSVDSTTPATEPTHDKTLAITNGWLTIDGAIATGGRTGVPWWSQTLRTPDMSKAELAITRYVPGRIGRGYTDDLNDVASTMVEKGTLAIEQHPPLWYDRRRDDHERVTRMNGDTVAPYYEHPFARSGRDDVSADGLSKYDLTKLNPWYFSRLTQFADLASADGLVLVNCDYLQHSILEAGAHYADFPWRTFNNINDPGFPEPVNFAGDKRVFIGDQFYAVTKNPHLAELHRNYIRKSLDQFAGKTNVLHLTSEEYTGSAEFVQFWLDTIGQWEQEHNAKVLVGLYAPKDVQDAILADEKRAKVVDVIYARFNVGDDASWWYQPNGELFAPNGGQNLSPRQLYRAKRPKNAGFEQVIRAVHDYRMKYPGKPFVYAGDANAINWACLMGGGSLAGVPTMPAELGQAIVRMRPIDLPNQPAGQYALADDGQNNVLVYSEKGPQSAMPVDGYRQRWINLKDGSLSDSAASGGGATLIWLSKP